jgi:hypothetical protein
MFLVALQLGNCSKRHTVPSLEGNDTKSDGAQLSSYIGLKVYCFGKRLSWSEDSLPERAYSRGNGCHGTKRVRKLVLRLSQRAGTGCLPLPAPSKVPANF